MPVIDRTVNRHNVIYGTSEMKRMTGIRLHSPHFFLLFSFLFFPPFFEGFCSSFEPSSYPLLLPRLLDLTKRNDSFKIPFYLHDNDTFEYSSIASDKEREITDNKRYRLITLVFFRRKLISNIFIFRYLVQCL